MDGTMSREAKASSWPLSQVGACRCRCRCRSGGGQRSHQKPKGSNVASGLMIFRPWPPCMTACFKQETETHVAPSVGAGNLWAPDERTCSEKFYCQGKAFASPLVSLASIRNAACLLPCLMHAISSMQSMFPSSS